MKQINIDDNWVFRRGYLDSLGMMDGDPGVVVNLPHDGMIGTEVSADAEAKYDSGYFKGDVSSYTKIMIIPKEYEGSSIGLYFDGSMMHTSVEINGCKVDEHHYGYTPFYVDITDYVVCGEENRITVNVNAGTQSSSRWYTGSGLYRSVYMCVGPKVHIDTDGIYMYTKELSDEMAYLEAQIGVCNDTLVNHLVRITVSLVEEDTKAIASKNTTVIQVDSSSHDSARMAFRVNAPKLWDIDCPNLYEVKVQCEDLGIYRTHLIENSICPIDEASIIFGIRTISVDPARGLRINGKTVKLKGGCIHHDNGLLGTASLYETEARKVKKLKTIGFNAIRTAHNPPSSALVEACDRLGMYIFDEVFDSWRIAKRTGDFSQFFDLLWEKELTSFVMRDRVHPSVIMWSTGNEIPERGGLNNGYTLAHKLAEKIRSLDSTRPISNGICSLWSGLDDKLARGQNQAQNATADLDNNQWEKVTEPFTNGLDIVGYNYLEELYEKDHDFYPERVILGSENFPKEIGFRWPVVEKLPYVIGDFTWTSWDYIGEAGIGKSVFVDPDDPLVEQGSWAVMPPSTSPYPWRLANDADIDITGMVRPQGEYRSIVWGNSDTFVYAIHPKHFGKTEVISMWGFTDVAKCWNYAGYEGKPIEVVVFSNAEEVELILDGEPIAKKCVSQDKPLPCSVRFETVYKPGKLEAVSLCSGKEVSRAELVTTGAPHSLRLTAEKENLKADGHDVTYVNIEVVDENDLLVPDAEVILTAKCEGDGFLAGFGSANPITEDNYTRDTTETFKGRAQAVIRSGYTAGNITLEISAEGMTDKIKLAVN